MKNNLLSVKELAELRAVTPETLRHYDRIGLFRPEYIDPQTKYRYYSVSQYEKLGTIKELRQLGMSLEEIGEYFAGRNVEKSLRILNEHYEMLVQEVRRKSTLKTVLGEKLKSLSKIIGKIEPGVVTEEEIGVRRILTYGIPVRDRNALSLDIVKLEANLADVAPILATDRIGCYSENYDFSGEQSFPPVPMIFLDKHTRAARSGGDASVMEIPAGRYICVYHVSKFGEYNESFQSIAAHIERNKYNTIGMVVQYYQIDITLTDDFSETMMRTEVLAQKKTGEIKSA